MQRKYILRSVVFLMALSSLAFGAKSPFNVDFYCGWSGYYRPMEWTPVEISIQSDMKEAFQGSIVISAQQDGLNTMNVLNRFVLTPDLPHRVPLVTKFAFSMDKCTVRILDERGRTKWTNDYNLWDYSNNAGLLNPVYENDMLIGVAGSKVFGLVGLPKETVCRSYRGPGKVYVGDKYPRMIPWDWTGFACLDLLILYNPEWTALNGEQVKAISDWVYNGGKLLVVLGNNPLTRDNKLSELLPYDIEQAKEFTVDTDTLKKLNLVSKEPENVICWSLVPKSDSRIYKNQSNGSGEILFGAGYWGFGRVGVLALDPYSLSDRQKGASTDFWVGKIRTIVEKTFDEASAERADNSLQGDELPQSNALMSDLTHPDRKQTGIILTISGLGSGEYRMTSYHNDPSRQRSPIDIYVAGKLDSSNNPQSVVTGEAKGSMVHTEFRASDNNNVVIEFRPAESEYDRRAVLNGFWIVKKNEESGGYRKFLAVDIGASGQEVADGFIGVGYSSSERVSEAVFDSSDGLMPGIKISLKPGDSNDTLQFIQTIYTSGRYYPPQQRMSESDKEAARRYINGRSIAKLESDGKSENESNQPWQRNYDVSIAQIGNNAVMEHLYAISELRPLSIWWVLLILGLLALLLGPIDYKVLKRLDRLPLTWVTSAGWIIIFTVGAYYGVQYLRGGTMQYRVISVIDGIKDRQGSWSTVYSGLFAPRSDTYELEPLGNNQWWSGIAPAQNQIYYHQQSGSRNISCIQEDGGNLPTPIPVNIWTMQCLLQESLVKDIPFDASVNIDKNKVSVDIRNKSRSNIKGGYVLAGTGKMMKFGRVKPESSMEFSGELIRSSIWEDESSLNIHNYNPWDSYGVKFTNENTFYAQGVLQRTQMMKAFLEDGAAIVCVEYEDAESPFMVKDRSCRYSHIQLARQVVFPVK